MIHHLHIRSFVSSTLATALLFALAAPASAADQNASDTAEPASKASALQPRESAAVGAKGSWSVGIFNPIEYSVSDKLAIRAHPWPVLRPVSVDVRMAHVTGAWQITGEYGLELPGLGNFGAMPLGIKGDLVPACKVAAHDPSKADQCRAPGFTIAPRVGLRASTGAQHVFTGRFDVAVGIPLGEKGQPLDALPNLDLAWAASNNGWRLALGGRYDRALTSGVRWASELNLFMVAPEEAQGTGTARSPLTASAWTGIDIAVGAKSRFTIGVVYYNSDQRRTEMVAVGDYSVREPIRSHDFFPTIDFIWGGG